MSSVLRTLLLALALSLTQARDFSPSVGFNLRHDKLGSGVNVDSLKGDLSLESKINDDLSVGANLEHGGEGPLKSLFAKVSRKFGDGKVDATLAVSIADSAVDGQLTYAEGSNEIVASFDSRADDILETVEFTRKGDGWSFKPRFSMKDRRLDLEAETDVTDNTKLNVQVAQEGDSQLKLTHDVDSSTHLKVTTNTRNLNLEIERNLDDNNSIRPAFDVGAKHLSLAWIRKLGNDRTLTATVDPSNSVDLELDGEGDDWSAKVSAPWGNPRDVDVSFGKKFSF